MTKVFHEKFEPGKKYWFVYLPPQPGRGDILVLREMEFAANGAIRSSLAHAWNFDPQYIFTTSDPDNRRVLLAMYRAQEKIMRKTYPDVFEDRPLPRLGWVTVSRKTRRYTFNPEIQKIRG